MRRLSDPIKNGLKRGWKVPGGVLGPVPEKIICDVALIGSGAGAGMTAELLAKDEQRLNITPWLVAPNENNDLLRSGDAQLGIPAAIARNAAACWNLGSCGLGCPTNGVANLLAQGLAKRLTARDVSLA